FVVKDFDRIGEVLGLGARSRDAHGDQLADLAHLAGGEHRLLGGLEALEAGDGADRLYVFQVFSGKDGLVIALRYFSDKSVGDRRAHEGDLEHSRKADVGDVLALAEQEASVFLSRKAGADPF